MSKHVKNQSHTDNYGGYPVFDVLIRLQANIALKRLRIHGVMHCVLNTDKTSLIKVGNARVHADHSLCPIHLDDSINLRRLAFSDHIANSTIYYHNFKSWYPAGIYRF